MDVGIGVDRAKVKVEGWWWEVEKETDQHGIVNFRIDDPVSYARPGGLGVFLIVRVSKSGYISNWQEFHLINCELLDVPTPDWLIVLLTDFKQTIQGLEATYRAVIDGWLSINPFDPPVNPDVPYIPSPLVVRNDLIPFEENIRDFAFGVSDLLATFELLETRLIIRPTVALLGVDLNTDGAQDIVRKRLQKMVSSLEETKNYIEEHMDRI